MLFHIIFRAHSTQYCVQQIIVLVFWPRPVQTASHHIASESFFIWCLGLKGVSRDVSEEGETMRDLHVRRTTEEDKDTAC
jgi:hypothetical protein